MSYDLQNHIQIKLDKLYDSLEQEVELELQKHQNAAKSFENKLESVKNRVEILSSIERIFSMYSESDPEVQNLKQALLIQVCDLQLHLRFVQEKELLLKGYFKSIDPYRVPTVIDLNREYIIRRRQVESDLLARFLLEESGFEKYKEDLAAANMALDRAIDLGDIKELSDCNDMYNEIFERVFSDSGITAKNQEKFRKFHDEIKAVAQEVLPFTRNDVANYETFSHLYSRIQKERLQLEKQVEKAMYHFAKMNDGRKAILNEIKHDRGSIVTLILKVVLEKEVVHQLYICKSELVTQKNHLQNNKVVTDPERIEQDFIMLEKKFRKIVSRSVFEKFNPLKRLFTGPKQKIQKMFIPNETSLYNKVLTQVLNNDNISIHDKHIIIRIARDSSLTNTHTGKFFFQRSGKINSRHFINEIEMRHMSKEVSSLRH